MLGLRLHEGPFYPVRLNIEDQLRQLLLRVIPTPVALALQSLPLYLILLHQKRIVQFYSAIQPGFAKCNIELAIESFLVVLDLLVQVIEVTSAVELHLVEDLMFFADHEGGCINLGLLGLFGLQTLHRPPSSEVHDEVVLDDVVALGFQGGCS